LKKIPVSMMATESREREQQVQQEKEQHEGEKGRETRCICVEQCAQLAAGLSLSDEKEKADLGKEKKENEKEKEKGTDRPLLRLSCCQQQVHLACVIFLDECPLCSAKPIALPTKLEMQAKRWQGVYGFLSRPGKEPVQKELHTFPLSKVLRFPEARLVGFETEEPVCWGRFAGAGPTDPTCILFWSPDKNSFRVPSLFSSNSGGGRGADDDTQWYNYNPQYSFRVASVDDAAFLLLQTR
jgi:hypothetical protein